MKRLFKFLLNLILALIAVGITFAILFFLNPSWQKAAVEKILAEDNGRQWQVESVRILPAKVEAGGLFVLDEPLGAEVQLVSLDGPFWMTPVNGLVKVDRGEVTGIFIDLVNLPVGDLTSSDWQAFLGRLRTDQAFWENRIDLVLSKLAASGWDFYFRDLRVSGEILLPGQERIPFRWLILEADSRESGKTRIEPLREVNGVQL